MDPESDVSVILPVYNVGAFIDQTLDSIRHQTAPPREVLVVDDCSTDDTAARVARTALPGLKFERLSENRGPWFARNVALGNASSEWVTFIDGDDWYEPGRLEVLLRHAEAHEADLVIDDMARWNEDATRSLGTTLGIRGLRLREPTPFTALDFVNWDLGVTKPLIRRSFLQKHDIRFNGLLRSGGDFSMFLTVLLRGGRGLLVPEANYNYRFRAGQITRDRDRLFRGTALANEDALAEAVRADARPVVKALKRRGLRIRRQQSVNSVIQHLRQRRLTKMLALLATDPGIVPWAARRVLTRHRWTHRFRSGRP